MKCIRCECVEFTELDNGQMRCNKCQAVKYPNSNHWWYPQPPKWWDNRVYNPYKTFGVGGDFYTVMD